MATRLWKFLNTDIHEFFTAQSQIMTTTSMLKNGWFLELIQTQRKLTQRNIQQVQPQQQQQPKRGLLWNRNPQPQGGQQ